MSITRESIELWLPCKSFPNLEVSNQGRVRVLYSTKRANIGRLLNQRDDKDGYKIIAVNRTTARVHRLVAEAFTPNPNSNEVAHHKDNIKHNNDASNLEWTTVSFNTKHAYHVEVLRSPKAKYIKASIDGEVFSYYNSCFKCSEAFNLGRDGIEKSVNNNTLYKGFIKLEEVGSIPEDAIVGRVLFTKKIPAKITPYRITYDSGESLVTTSAPDYARLIGKTRSTAHHILANGKSWKKYGITNIEKMSEEEYYRLYINW